MAQITFADQVGHVSRVGPAVRTQEVRSGDAHVWLAWPGPGDRLDRPDLLSDEELGTRARLHRDHDRALYTAAHVLARRALSQVVGGTPDRRAVVAAAHRRPRVPDHPRLDLSLSHTDQMVAVAIARDARCGVDVERLTSHPVLSPEVLSPRERTAVAADPARARAVFTRYWTLKEAISKVSGQGLTLPFGQVELTGPGTPPRILAGHHVITTACPDPRTWTLAHRIIRTREPGRVDEWHVAVALHTTHFRSQARSTGSTTPGSGRAATRLEAPGELPPDVVPPPRRRPM